MTCTLFHLQHHTGLVTLQVMLCNYGDSIMF